MFTEKLFLSFNTKNIRSWFRNGGFVVWRVHVVYVLVGNSKTFHAYSTNHISPCHNFVFCFFFLKTSLTLIILPFWPIQEIQGNNQTRLRSCNTWKKLKKKITNYFLCIRENLGLQFLCKNFRYTKITTIFVKIVYMAYCEWWIENKEIQVKVTNNQL